MDEKDFDWKKLKNSNNNNNNKEKKENNDINENEINISEDNYTDIYDENEITSYKTKAQYCSL